MRRRETNFSARVQEEGLTTLEASQVVAILLSAIFPPTAVAAAPVASTAQPNAVVELQAPVGTHIKVDGRDLGKMIAATRDIEYKDLKAGQERPVVIEAAFDNKTKTRKIISLLRGQHVKVVIEPSDARRPELVIQTGHSENITSIAFSPDGSQILTGSRDNSVLLWDASTGQQLRTFAIKGPKSVAFSPDGKQVLAPGEEDSRIWDRITGEQIIRFSDRFNFAGISPEGRYLGWGSYSQAGLWDLVAGKKLQAIETEKFAKGLSAQCGAWNRRGTLLALGGGDFDKPHTIVVWDPFLNRTVVSLPNKFRRLAAVAFSPDESLIITASGEYREPGQVAVWDARSGEHLRDFSDVPSQPKSLEFTADGTRLLTVASNAAVIWDFESGKQLVKFARKMDEEYFSIECAAFSPDGKRIATGGSPNRAMIWDSTTGKRLETLRGRSPENRAVAVSPDGQFIAVAAGGSICLWEAASGSVARVLNGPWLNVTSVAFDPDSRWLASGSWDHSANIWDVQTGALLATAGNPASVDVAFINGGKEFVLAREGGISICDTKTRRPVRSIPLEAKWYSLTAHGGDRHVLVHCPGGSIKASEFVLLDCDSARAVRTIKSEGCSFGRGYFDPLRNRVIAQVTRERDRPDKEPTASEQCQVVAWEADGTNRVVIEVADGQEIAGLTLSGNGEKLAACVRNPEQPGRICVWSGDTFDEKLTLESDHGFISDLLISPNGTRLAASYGKYDEAGNVVIWELNDPKKKLQLPGRLGHVRRMAFTSDGERLITAGGEIDRGELFEWDLAAGRQVRSLQGHKHAVTHLATSQDGMCLLTCDIVTVPENSILWDLSTGSKLRIWKGHSGCVNAVNFSPDGKRLLTAGGRHDGELFLWDVAEGELVAEYTGAALPYSHAAFSHDESRIVAGASNITRKADGATRKGISYLGDTIFVWDVQSRRLLKSWKRDDDQALCFDRNGDKILTRKGCIIDVRTGALEVSPPGHVGFIECAAISDDGRWGATGDMRGGMILWDANTGRQIRRFGGHADRPTGSDVSQWVSAIAISPDNRRVATASFNGTAVIWALATGARLATLTGHKGRVTAIAFTRDGKKLATGGFDSQVILWDVATGRRLDTVLGKGWNVRSVAFSPDGRRLLSCHGNKLAYITDIASRKQLVSLPGNKQALYCVAYSPDGKWAYTGGDGGAGFLWDARTLKGIHRLPDEGYIHSAAFSRDSRTLFVGGNDMTRVFDVASGRERSRLSFKGSVFAVAAARGADRFAVADGESITVFDQSSLRRVCGMRPLERVSAASLSQDGTRLLLGDWGGRAMLYDAKSGNDIQSFEGHSADVKGVAFMPDGRRVVSASSDGSSAVWDAATGDMLLRMIVLDDGRDWLAVTPEGLFDGSPGGRASVKVRASGGLDLEPIDRFFQDFYRPGLLAEVVRGERPMPQRDFASRMAPLVEITSPRQDRATADARVTIEVDVTNRGGGVKGPWIMQNGARVVADGERQESGATVRQTFVLGLVEGENRLEARAASGDGSWESDPAVLVLRYEKPLPKPALHLVAVGINKYRQETMNLRFAAADAREVAKVFQTRGPSLYGDDRTHVTQLIDEQATQQGIREALGHVATAANPQDTVVVFLAGHGTTVGQRYYFITQDFKQQDDFFEEDVRAQGLAADAIGDLLAKTRALKRVLIFDTCQSGGALALHQTARDPFAFRGALERLSHSQGVFTIAAAAANDQAQEAPQLKHGLLTYTLLAALGAVDDGPLAGQKLRPSGEANVVEVREWFSFAQDKVPLLTKLYFGQEQFVGFSGQGASFPILPLEVSR